ncbi:MAG: bifunctional DNA primase/polymerase, partial [Gammaproteobacteria bacterium]|nr:bifunctional DNA primase/polymerase [Gammaproteobacteria bacterium]
SRFPYQIDGGHRMPTGSPAQRLVDAETIFMDPKHVERGLKLAEEADRREQPMPEVRAPEAGETLSELGQAALAFANRGLYVFPILPRKKIPDGRFTPHGFKDATVDTERIMRFWRDNPEYNVAIVTGKDSGLFVLDVDDRSGGLETLHALTGKHGGLPQTTTVVTPSGGTHYFFRHAGGQPLPCTTNFPGPGLDLRADGGYVLAPPSVGSNGRHYEYDDRVAPALPPEWLVKALAEYREAMNRVDAADYARIFEGVPEGGRDDAFTRFVGHLFARGHAAEVVLGIASDANTLHCKPPMKAQQVRKIVDSIARREARRARKTMALDLAGAA